MDYAPFRAKDNTRPSNIVYAPAAEAEPALTAEEIAAKNSQQPPLFLILKRASAVTIELSNAVTQTVLYKVRDTGRGSMSSKPDFEIFRTGHNPAGTELFVGSLRLGKRGVEVKFPLTNRKLSDTESYTTSSDTESLTVKWEATNIGRAKGKDGAATTSKWIAELDCVPAGKTAEESVCCVKLVDSMPNGRFEVWDKGACVDVGGDWALLDEYVTMAYANMEAARRTIMKKGDPTKTGLGGLNWGGAA